MHETIIDIPNYKKVTLLHIVLDYNGTIAKDGILKESVKALLLELTQQYQVHVITADTFGSVHSQVKAFDCSVKVLESADHRAEKADFIKQLDAKKCVAMGNGNNDALMVQEAQIGIAILGDEGCSSKSLFNSDIVCKSIEDALNLLLYPKRLIATLRV